MAGSKDEVLKRAEGKPGVPDGIVHALRQTSLHALALMPVEGPSDRYLPGILFVIDGEADEGEIEPIESFAPKARTSAIGLLAERLWPGCAATIESVKPAVVGGRRVFEMRGYLEIAGRRAAAVVYGAPAGGRMYYVTIIAPEAPGSINTPPEEIFAAWKPARRAKTESFVYTRSGRYTLWGIASAAALAALAALIFMAVRRKPAGQGVKA
jgi:hypothetical protein